MAQSYANPPDMQIDTGKSHEVTLHTNQGDIEIELDAQRSPQAVNNFVFLARDGFYDDVIFHRVISGFMIQGGDPTGTGRGGPGYQFEDELEGEGRYDRGTVAMANAGPDTNGSQFFIMHRDYRLPHNYTIFGSVKSGMDVVDKIAETPTDRSDRPQTDCVIERVTVVES